MPHKSNEQIIASSECRLEELRFVLSEAIAEWKSEEVINNLKYEIILRVKSILRILGPLKMNIWADLLYKKKLEFKYIELWDEENLRKLREIEIWEEYIRIAGFELRRYNEEGIVKKENWIIKSPDGKYTLFNYHSASRQAYSTWHELIKKTQWEQIIDAAPWNSNKEKAINLTQLLNLPLIKSSAPKNEFLTTYIYYWIHSWASRIGKVLSLTKDKISPSFEKGLDYHWVLRLMKPAKSKK